MKRTLLGNAGVPTAALTAETTRAINAEELAARRGTIDIMGCGDSLTANAMPLARPGWQTELGYLVWAQMASAGKIRFIGQSALGGQTATQVRNICVPGILAATRKPTHCTVLVGDNDIWVAGNYGSNLAAIYASITGIYTDLLTGGIIPVACTIPGFLSSGGGTSGVLNVSNLMRVNDHVRRMAEQLGIPLADFFEVCSDPTADPTASTLNGTWRANYLSQSSSDAVHPGGIGCQAMGAHLASVLLPQGATALALSMWNFDGVNKIANGLMTTDVNADSIPDSWTQVAAGTGVTHSLVTDAAIRGKWWRVVKTAADDTTFAQSSIAVTPGQIVRCTFNLKINSIGVSPGKFRVSLLDNFNAGLVDPNAIPQDPAITATGQLTSLISRYWFQRSADGGTLAGSGPLVIEGVVAAGASSVSLNLTWNGPCDVQIGEVSIHVYDAAGTPAGADSPQATVPGAPTIGTALPRDSGARVNWTAGTTGGATITNYVVTPYIGAIAQTPTTVGNVATAAIGALTNGTAYTFKVAAVNMVGTGAPSAASNTVSPAVATAPPAPTIGTATAGETTGTQATAFWTAPASDGGADLTGYQVKTYKASDNSVLFTDTTGLVLTLIRTGLTTSVPVYFKVAAISSAGSGTQSAASNTVTPTVIAFSPSSLTNLQWWGEDLPLADAASVSSWTDLSGAAHHLTDSTGSRKPICKTGILNGLSVVRFSGAQWLQASFTQAQPWSLVVVAKLTSAAAQQGIADGFNSNAGIVQVVPGSGWAINAGSPVVDGAADASWHIFVVTWNAASSTFRVDGGAGVTGNPGTGNPGGITLGSWGNQVVPMTGDIYGGVVIGHALTLAEINNLGNYFKAKAPAVLTWTTAT